VTEPIYKVVWPLGKSTTEVRPLAERLPDLKGKTVCELYNQLFKGDVLFAETKKIFKEKFPGIKFVDHTNFGDIHGKHENTIIETLPDTLRKQGCDAVISAVGG
jgi:hypothetical protein